MQKLISLVLIVALATTASAGYYGAGIMSPFGYGIGMGYGYGLGYGMGLGFGGYGLGMGLGMGVAPIYNPLMLGGLGAMGKYY